MPRIELALPPDQVGGVFADFVRAWHTRDCFILDYSAYVEPPTHDDASDDIVQKSTVVARVRIPPAQVFELMKALELQLSAWETETKAK